MTLPEFLQDTDGYIHVAGHRVGLQDVVYYYNEGHSAEALAEMFPTLTLALIHKLIAFYLENQVDVDAYVIAGVTDHLCPWQSCYRTTQLLGGPVKFVLSTSGHIAAMVNPPDNRKAAFQTAPSNPANPDEFLAAARMVPGSWWTDYSSWLGERSGAQKKSPRQLGRKGHPVQCAAPGTYVHDR